MVGALCSLIRGFMAEGVTLMALLRCWAKVAGERCAVVRDAQRWSYDELYRVCRHTAQTLASRDGVRAGQTVYVACQDKMRALVLMVSLNRLGAHCRLVNPETLPELSAGELFCDDHWPELPRLMDSIRAEEPSPLPHRWRGGDLVVYSGGTAGKPREARRRSALLTFLPPLWALIRQVGIRRYDSLLVALPLYHGFGLASLITALALGKRCCLLNRFEAHDAVRMVEQDRIEVVPMVPALWRRMLHADGEGEALRSVRCVICGGDRLDGDLLRLTRHRMGDTLLYNLYGTTEAGFFLLATPQLLSQCKEPTLGKPIWGVRCELRDVDASGVGTLWVRSGWAMAGLCHQWQSTGDRMRRDETGRYYYVGRADRMVICAGENVSPERVEALLCAHPAVIDAWVYPVPDELFGQVLWAKVEIVDNENQNENWLKEWLRPQVLRAEMPHRILFGHIERRETGKQRIHY